MHKVAFFAQLGRLYLLIGQFFRMNIPIYNNKQSPNGLQICYGNKQKRSVGCYSEVSYCVMQDALLYNKN